MDRPALIALALVGASVADLPVVYLLVSADAHPALVIFVAASAMLVAFGAGNAIERRRPRVRLAVAALVILQLPVLAAAPPEPAPVGALLWAAVAGAGGVVAFAAHLTPAARGREAARPRPR